MNERTAQELVDLFREWITLTLIEVGYGGSEYADSPSESIEKVNARKDAIEMIFRAEFGLELVFDSEDGLEYIADQSGPTLDEIDKERANYGFPVGREHAIASYVRRYGKLPYPNT